MIYLYVTFHMHSFNASPVITRHILQLNTDREASMFLYKNYPNKSYILQDDQLA
jgi:hypothetical protein